jgi:UDP-N-acetylglucosamine 2-epimerase (non-hydrolysing)
MVSQGKKLAVVLGIRPDVIRAALILKKLKAARGDDIVFIWSGQHYSDNLKDIFFRELGVPRPDIELGAAGKTDAELVGSVVTKLYECLSVLRPEAVVFLGDTNTVMGSIACGQLNIPIVHIEGCMRSYDWRMPEEKYRTTIDHLSDVIYAYLPEYRQQGISEGIDPDSIVVTTNPIVDVLRFFFQDRKEYFNEFASDAFFRERRISRRSYYVMTCHRRENVETESSLRNVIDFVSSADLPVFFPASYRTQANLRSWKISVPEKVRIVDPVGYTEFLCLLVNSKGTITDSGTVVEEACVLGIPSVQMRKSTERPQVYDVGASVKFDPAVGSGFSHAAVWDSFGGLWGASWENPFGDGLASERIAADLLHRMESGTFRRRHLTDRIPFARHSYRSY